MNIHRKKVVLNSTLSVYGLGGSIPGYLKGKHEFHGFPYIEPDDIVPFIEEI